MSTSPHECSTVELTNNPETRVLIAKDVLERLNNQKLEVQEGNSYACFSEPLNSYDAELDAQLQDLLKVSTSPCRVCALGALFISSCNRFNQLKVNQLKNQHEITRIEGSDIYDYLGKFFSTHQLWLIERAYENFESNVGSTRRYTDQTLNSYGDDPKPDYGPEIRRASSDFFYRYNTSADRLTAIMQNIIDNNGTFIPLKNEVVPIPQIEYADGNDE